MALPFVLFIIVFYYAQLFGWLYAFMDYKAGKAVWEQTFVGLENFKKLFAHGSRFIVAFRNSMIFGVLGILTAPLPGGVCDFFVGNQKFKDQKNDTDHVVISQFYIMDTGFFHLLYVLQLTGTDQPDPG